jgi:hypothetical protein
MKGMRFVYYTLPLVFAVWAIAAVTLLPALHRAASTGIARVRELSRTAQSLVRDRYVAPAAVSNTRSGRATAAVLVSAAILFALVGNPMYDTLKQLPKTIASDLTLVSGNDMATQASIERQRAALLALVDAGVVATSNELRALYHLGRYDVLLRPTRLSEVAPGREFARDPRTGGPVISTSESLRSVVECYPRGSMLVWGNDWGLPYAINSELADAIATSMQEVAVPGPLEVRAFRWEHAPSADTSCAAVRDALSRRARAAKGAGLTNPAHTLSAKGSYHTGRAVSTCVPQAEPTAISPEPHERA